MSTDGTFGSGTGLSSAFINWTRRFAGKGQYFGQTLANLYVPDPNSDWLTDAGALAAIATHLVDVDPVFAALRECRLTLTLGERGLRWESRYDEGGDGELSAHELLVRRQSNGWVGRSYMGTTCDAGAQIHRVDLERQIGGNHLDTGDGWAIRIWAGQRPGAHASTAWRVLDSTRVCNPTGCEHWQYPDHKPELGKRAPRGHIIFAGIELDKSHRPAALWYKLPKKDTNGDQTWARIPWWSDDGCQNVIHRFSPARPGALRGFSPFGPLLFPTLQLAAATESYSIGKRIQASHPVFRKVEDPQAQKTKDTSNAQMGDNRTVRAAQEILIGQEDDVIFPPWTFDGKDHTAFVDSMARLGSAAWQIPYQYVLAEISGVSMASGRLVVDRAYRTGIRFQNDHIPQVTEVIDRSYLYEGIQREAIAVAEVEDAMAGCEWERPRRSEIDPLKDAMTAEKWIDLGDSQNAQFRERLGRSFDAAQQRRRQEAGTNHAGATGTAKEGQK